MLPAASSRAFLCVDLQRAFFPGSGVLDSGKLLQPGDVYPAVAAIATVATANPSDKMVWIRSDYSATASCMNGIDKGPHDPPTREGQIGRNFTATHIGKWSDADAAFEPSFQYIFDAHRDAPNHHVVTKTCYSAFQGATGLGDLVAGSELFVFGVFAHVCVRATILHALELGFTVSLVVDATSTYSPKKFLETVEELKRAGCNITSLVQLIPTALLPLKIHLPFLAAGDCSVNFGCVENHKKVAEAVAAEVPWGRFTMQGNEVPRLVATQGTVVGICYKHSERIIKTQTPSVAVDPCLLDLTHEEGVYEPLYRHPVDDVLPTMRWTPQCLELRNVVHSVTGVSVNHALIQQYRYDAKTLMSDDNIGPHSDKVIDMRGHKVKDGPGGWVSTPVCNINLGGTRAMEFSKKKQTESTWTVDSATGSVAPRHTRVFFPPGSVFVMGPKTNRDWHHMVKKQCDTNLTKLLGYTALGCGVNSHDEALALVRSVGRISLTLRDIATWKRRHDGAVFGQGAPKQHFVNPFAVQSQQILTAFGADNAQTDAEFDWGALYGQGFDLISVRPKDVLFYINGSVSSIRAKMMLRCVGIDDFVEYRMRIMRKYSQTFTRYFTRLNPRHECPVLVLRNGVKINESLAILTYLDRFHTTTESPSSPKLNFLPISMICDGEVQALAYAWMQETENTGAVLERVEEVVYHPERLARQPPHPDHCREVLNDVDDELALWAARLKANGHKFLFSDTNITVTDIALFSVLAYLWRRGCLVHEADAVLKNYYDSMLQHPAVVPSLPQGWATARSKTNVFDIVRRIARGEKVSVAGQHTIGSSNEQQQGSEKSEDDE